MRFLASSQASGALGPINNAAAVSATLTGGMETGSSDDASSKHAATMVPKLLHRADSLQSRLIHAFLFCGDALFVDLYRTLDSQVAPCILVSNGHLRNTRPNGESGPPGR